MNEQVIDTVITPSTDEQVITLTKLLADLDIQMTQNIKSANALNTATGNSKSFKELGDNSTKNAIAFEKVTQAQNKTAASVVDLEKKTLALSQAQQRAETQQKKSAEAAQKALSPYQQLSKELDTLRAKAKDAGAQFGIHSQQFKDASKPVQELDEKLKGIDQTLGQSQRNVGNYGNAFKGVLTQYIPFGEGTLRIGENLKALGVDFEESAAKLGVLGSGFVAFSTAAFIAAIASAAYYLSQFKSTGNEVEKFLGGLKEQFANFGGNIIEGIKNFSFNSLLNLIPVVAAYNAGKGFKESFAKGVDDAAVKIDLVNADELDEAQNRALKAQSEYFRALAANRKLDIKDRLDYVHKAQEAEGKIVQNQTENSKLYLANAILIGDKRKKLTDEQTSRLLQGDLKYAQELSESGQQFSKEGYELYKKGIEKQLEAKEGATNRIVQLQADADNMEFRDRRELTKALEDLDASRIQGQLLREKLILENDDKNYDTKLKALEDFTNNSKKLAKIKLADDLAAAQVPGRAGLDPKIVAAKEAKARQDYQNEITKIDSEAQKQRQDLEKKDIEARRKNLQELLAANKGVETQAIDNLQTANNERLSIIEDSFDKEVNLVNQKYIKGKIDQKQAQDELLKLDDQYNIDRLGQEVFLQQSILEIKEAALANDIELAKNRGASPDEITALTNKSGVAQQKNAVSKAGTALNKAVNKQGIDDIKIQEDEKTKRQKAEIYGLQQTMRVVDDSDKLRQKAYENEIARLEKLAQQVDDNANAEKEAVNNSIASNATKAREIAVIDARANAQRKAIQADENRIKQKEAIAEKEAAISKIILETAIAAIKAPAELGPILGLAAVPIVLALGAVELAAALAAPIPKFAQGGKTPGGLVLWGEAGMESARLPDGSVKYSTGPTLEALPRGTEITPHMQLMQQIRPEAVRYAGGEQVGWKEVVKAIRDNKPDKRRSKTVLNVDMGYENYKRSYLTR